MQKKIKNAGMSLEESDCHQHCEPIKGGHGYVDKKCSKKCQKLLKVKAMPKDYDDPAKARKRMMKGMHFGKSGPQHHKRGKIRRR